MTQYEKVIRPIVEGQVKKFIQEHPALLDCVQWFKPRIDKSTTFVNSLSKRILRDLLSDENVTRVKNAFLADGLSLDDAGNSNPSTQTGVAVPPSEPGWYYALPVRYEEHHAEAAMIVKVVKDRAGILMVNNGQSYPLDQFKWYGKVPVHVFSLTQNG